MKTTSQKISTLFLICLIALAITGYTYSHWTDRIHIFSTVNMAHLEITIYDQKLIPDIGYNKNTNYNKTLLIEDHIATGWELWVGIIIKNHGTLPATITHYQITKNILFGNETHFYGPYTTVPTEVWCDLSQTNLPPPASPPPPGETTPPIDLPIGDKLVVWQKIWLQNPLPPEFAGTTITCEYFATFSGWYDRVTVIYDLYKR